ncbi:MAG: hypothetical protein COA66_13650 [Arcobacter sp.]|nr:MAG: hypothetical protein COA66_13650 [Arcobacter sp.]
MNPFFSNIPTDNIKYVGFDMDGTLYDEFEFIIQVYTEISSLFIESDKCLSFMLQRWLQKGSSYNLIFDETFDIFKLKNKQIKCDFINLALNIFRNYSPKLILPNRSKCILTFLKEEYTLFLISDGNEKLQREKYFSLNLDKYFDISNVCFTGKYSSDSHKPNIESLNYLNIIPEQAVFIGDRICDEEFATNAKMKFKKVYNMIERH